MEEAAKFIPTLDRFGLGDDESTHEPKDDYNLKLRN
jgi:hypothetical protein